MTALEKRPETQSESVRDFALHMEETDVRRQENTPYNSPQSNTETNRESALCVGRTDISFKDVAGGKVRIQVTVHNPSTLTSRPTTLTIEAAPFGAFVPWKPLAMLPVRALEPGEAIELVTEVARPHPAPLGNFDRVPPKKLLTALGSADQPSPADGFAMLRLLAAMRHGLLPGAAPGRKSPTWELALPPDLMELVGRPNLYWAGNLNVFIGSRPVERHLSQALRIYPGFTNMAFFIVGDPVRKDAYAFNLAGLSPDWQAKLYNATNNNSLVVGPSDTPIGEEGWVEAMGDLVVVLAVCPPYGCEEGDLKIHVTRRSCGKTAIVEFNLDPASQGAGCYTA